MAIRIVVMLGIILLLAGFIAVCAVGFSKRKKVMQGIGIAGIILSVLGFIGVPFSIYTVDTGEVAVVKFLGQAEIRFQDTDHINKDSNVFVRCTDNGYTNDSAV